MFRLIQLHAGHGTPRIGAGPDGYTSESAALARIRTSPAAFFGVGRFDTAGRLAEVILDAGCGPAGDCPRPAVVVHVHTYQRLCGTCSAGVQVFTVPELAVRLGVAVRLAPVLARFGRHRATGFTGTVSNRIARELATHVTDPSWRAALCAELARAPGSVNGLLIGVGALSDRDVLDLYPALCTLGTLLPGDVHAHLRRATVRPLSPAGLAARRLGL